MSSEPPPKFWRVGEDIQPSPLSNVPLWNPELWNTVEEEIDGLDAGLRELSLSIHGRPSDSSNSSGGEIDPTSSLPRAIVRGEVR